MRKLRWVRDEDGLWDLDVSTPATINGVARPVPGDPIPSVLGLSRGIRLSRPKQADFFQRFMFMPFIPSYSSVHPHGNGCFSLQRVLSLPTFSLDRWFGTVLGQFNVEKFVSNIKKNGFRQPSSSSWFQSIGKHLSDKSLYGVDLSSEFFLTPDDTFLLSLESYGDDDYKTPRKKAVFNHKFAHHNLTVEAASPGLFVDKDGTFWDVPLTMAMDLASVASSSDNGPSYHISINHNTGLPKEFGSHQNGKFVASLQPGLSATTAFSLRNSIDIWRSGAPKMKMIQPYDIFLSNPHISASGIIGAVMTACFGDNSIRVPQSQSQNGASGGCSSSKVVGFGLSARRGKCAVLADSFATVTLSAQHGTFQKMFFDLTRFQALLDFPSGSTFISGAARLAKDVFNSHPPNQESLQQVCPNTTFSFQQQIVGPFSMRVDSGVELGLKKGDRFVKVKDPVFAIEYALQVLGSAKAVAWYSPTHKEFMIELRFFET
ncbi:protein TRIGALACTOSYLDIACYLGLYCEROL 4, chloroplastic [Rutidosis leptorrhynchoides]|uniref:protein TRIGALACTOSYLDIACYLGLYCEROL 4, chloroplastic n=1 Tax=Rutidosis leptorrhynchoides TaxID=125765 RepID=UPI003A991DAA